jgi:anti-sigma-K factor RskA
MTDHQEEMLALHAMRTLTPEEVRLLESEARYDPRMRETLEEFEETAAEIARLLPDDAPPEDVRSQILAEVKARARANVVPFSAPFRLLRNPIVAWAAAAAIAIAAFGLWKQNHQLDQRAAELAQSEASSKASADKARAEEQDLVKKLTDADTKISDLSKQLQDVTQKLGVKNMELAVLRATSTNSRYAEGSAAVVWNQERQEGILKIENMPGVQGAKDYQLWVVCKQCKHPVSAGVIKVEPDGTTSITFKPKEHIAEALKFAISVEEKGGVPVKSETGPIILASR